MKLPRGGQVAPSTREKVDKEAHAGVPHRRQQMCRARASEQNGETKLSPSRPHHDFRDVRLLLGHDSQCSEIRKALDSTFSPPSPPLSHLACLQGPLSAEAAEPSTDIQPQAPQNSLRQCRNKGLHGHSAQRRALSWEMLFNLLSSTGERAQNLRTTGC